MKDWEQIMQELSLDSHIPAEHIPRLELYADQVLQLFEQHFAPVKRHEDDKILTKTMINNYAKGKLFFPVRNKRYSPEHVMIISLIYQLKGTLSIQDSKTVLEGLNRKTVEGDLDLGRFYQSYLKMHEANAELFPEEVKKHAETAAEQIEWAEGTEELEDVLLILSLVQMSNMYRRMAEALTDRLAADRSDKAAKQKNEERPAADS